MITMTDQPSLGAAFRALHEREEIFVMPNAWNPGSAMLLEQTGFKAIGTTSAGIAFNLGLPDYCGALDKEAALSETRRIAQAIQLPLSADAENGYGHEPDRVAETIGDLSDAGVVGANIEDYSSDESIGMYDISLATDRITAACAAAELLPFPFTVTARAECYLAGSDNPLSESIERANRYREAGAHCLFVPGPTDAQTIKTLVEEIDGPINVVMGLSGQTLSVSALEDLGVRRISIGGSLARSVLGYVRRAATEILTEGSFGYAADQIADGELCDFFLDRRRRLDESR